MSENRRRRRDHRPGGEALLSLASSAPSASASETAPPHAFAVPHLRAPAFSPGQRVAGRYRVEQLLGAGGMGEVYEARDMELSVPVALKALRAHLAGDEAALRRLKLELLLARSISHPHVCRVYDLGRHGMNGGAVWFLTMELLRGETLRDRLRHRGRFTETAAMLLVEQMVAGLAAAHRAGVVHLDFKSGNVMLIGDGPGERAVVTDFGLARTAGPAAASWLAGAEEAVAAPRIAGTPDYMAPEQVRGEAAGPAADIYALGVVLYEMMTAKLPFAGRTPLEVAERRLTDAAPSPRLHVPDLDSRWEAVILRCLALSPRERFARVEEVAETLTAERSTQVAASAREATTQVRHALPAERDAFIGRGAELADMAARFARGSRLVTLLAPAGMGKTRLAVRYGWQSRMDWPGGVWVCDLAEARSVNGILSAVASALGVPLGKADPIAQLGHAIAGRERCLVILDNCEQVAAHAAEIVSCWLERAARARFLVTSRERLRVHGEEVLAVEPLGLEPGVELFLERAGRQHPGLTTASADLAAVREVVRQAEGMPLAIELAAARMSVMTPRELVKRMRERWQVLQGGRRGRHASLRAAIEVSWELLTPWEQAAWAQCAVFEAGFTLEAAEAVVDLSPWPEAPWVVDVVQSLVDKSLLRVWVPDGGAEGPAPDVRFGMYLSLQEYARERLRESGPDLARAVEERHGRWFARHGTQEAMAGLNRAGGAAKHRVLGREIENLVSACRRGVARGDGEVAAMALRATWAALEAKGPLGAAVELGQEVLGMPGLGPADRASTLVTLGLAEWRCGKMEQALSRFAAALPLTRELGDRLHESVVLENLGLVLSRHGRAEEARATHEAALAIKREAGDRSGERIALLNMGSLDREQGRVESARARLEEALELARELGDRAGEGSAINILGALNAEQGRMEEARACFEQALAIAREFGDRRVGGIILDNLGLVSLEQQRPTEARAYLDEALAIHREVGDRRSEAIVRNILGSIHRDDGRMEEARTQYEAALAIAREVSDRRTEGASLGNLGHLQFQQGRLDAARDILDQAQAILRNTDRTAFAKALCISSELQRASGDLARARATLAEAEAVAAELGAGPESELGKMLARLRLDLERDPP